MTSEPSSSNAINKHQTELDKVVLASGNKKKLTELSAILTPMGLDLYPQSNFSVAEAVEDGLTFIENALIKARHACEQTGLPAIADDSGIEVDFLQGKPGIYSARFAGENSSDKANLERLLSELKNVPKAQRTARYQCVIVFLKHTADPTPIVAQASWEGIMLDSPIGNGGFGYDPIFYCPILKQTAAELTPEKKASISHRGKALRKFAAEFDRRQITSTKSLQQTQAVSL